MKKIVKKIILSIYLLSIFNIHILDARRKNVKNKKAPMIKKNRSYLAQAEEAERISNRQTPTENGTKIVTEKTTEPAANEEKIITAQEAANTPSKNNTISAEAIHEQFNKDIANTEFNETAKEIEEYLIKKGNEYINQEKTTIQDAKRLLSDSFNKYRGTSEFAEILAHNPKQAIEKNANQLIENAFNQYTANNQPKNYPVNTITTNPNTQTPTIQDPRKLIQNAFNKYVINN